MQTQQTPKTSQNTAAPATPAVDAVTLAKYDANQNGVLDPADPGLQNQTKGAH